MAQTEDELQEKKISSEFKARLEGLKPEEKVRAIVLLRVEQTQNGFTTQQEKRTNRQTLVNTIRDRAAAALPEIDKILNKFNGKRLTQTINALGSISVETTAAGIIALASSKYVKSILEDQPISSLKLKSA